MMPPNLICDGMAAIVLIKSRPTRFVLSEAIISVLADSRR